MEHLQQMPSHRRARDDAARHPRETPQPQVCARTQNSAEEGSDQELSGRGDDEDGRTGVECHEPAAREYPALWRIMVILRSMVQVGECTVDAMPLNDTVLSPFFQFLHDLYWRVYLRQFVFHRAMLVMQRLISAPCPWLAPLALICLLLESLIFAMARKSLVSNQIT